MMGKHEKHKKAASRTNPRASFSATKKEDRLTQCPTLEASPPAIEFLQDGDILADQGEETLKAPNPMKSP